MKHLSLLILLIFLVNPGHSEAKEWRNAFISFEIPDRWKCLLEQTEWVCRSDDAREAKESIIILTAKEVGPVDTMAMYEAHLQNPIPVTLPGGQLMISRPFKKPEKVQIRGLTWVDGFHLESEVPNYFTRYLATVRDRIAVLVTFSAYKDDYARYSADFSRAIQSLTIIASKNLGSSPADGIRDRSGVLFAREQTLLPNEPYPEMMMPKKKDKSLYYALAVVLTAIGIYLLYRSQKK